nr:DUF3842 family protein [uncultured Enterocloster sp.]
MKLVIIDGQGGKMGRTVIEQLKKNLPDIEIYAIGTNSIATSAMLKAGADYGATGENPVIVGARTADIIIGPIGIVIADALMGEITPAMSAAIGQSSAYKILIPVNRCNHYIAGCGDHSLGEYIKQVCEETEKEIKKRENR